MNSGSFLILPTLLVSILHGQVNSRQPDARMIWSNGAGRLESGKSHAVVTVLVFEDAKQPGERTRGVRIDLSWPDGKGAIYLDEGLLEPEKKIFDQLSLDIRSDNLQGGAGWGFIGSCEFRNNPGEYPLEADFNYSGPHSPALRIFGPKGEQILFPGLMPSDLSKALGSAINELKAH